MLAAVDSQTDQKRRKCWFFFPLVGDTFVEIDLESTAAHCGERTLFQESLRQNVDDVNVGKRCSEIILKFWNCWRLILRIRILCWALQLKSETE